MKSRKKNEFGIIDWIIFIMMVILVLMMCGCQNEQPYIVNYDLNTDQQTKLISITTTTTYLFEPYTYDMCDYE